jgi:hypothetical protein
LANHNANGYLHNEFATALVAKQTSFGNIIKALYMRGGAIRSQYLAGASGQPVLPAKGHIDFAFILNRLLDTGLIRKRQDSTGEIVTLWDCEGMSSEQRATVFVEDLALAFMLRAFSNIGWVSAGKSTTRSTGQSRVGQFCFDLVGPSYASSMRSRPFSDPAKPIPGFFFCDILLAKSITISDLDPFFHKVAVLQMQKRKQLLQPMFMGDNFEPGALRRLREKGYLVGTPKSVFGDEVSQQLQQLVAFLSDAASAVSQNPQEFFDLMARLSKMEGAALNLRGPLFEFIVMRLVDLAGFSIEFRQDIQANGKRTDIDVLARKKGELICCECKGYSPGKKVSVKEIREWLDVTIPTIKAWAKSLNPRCDDIQYRFSEAAEVEIAGLNPSTRVEFIRPTQIEASLKDERQSKILQLYREQFT